MKYMGESPVIMYIFNAWGLFLDMFKNKAFLLLFLKCIMP